jgi:hypothetical protein
MFEGFAGELYFSGEINDKLRIKERRNKTIKTEKHQ